MPADALKAGRLVDLPVLLDQEVRPRLLAALVGIEHAGGRGRVSAVQHDGCDGQQGAVLYGRIGLDFDAFVYHQSFFDSGQVFLPLYPG